MDLFQNPFYILGATQRDNRQHLSEIAEEKSLLGDSAACNEARSVLLNPVRRLSAEVSWLPGLDPEMARNILSNVKDKNFDESKYEDIPPTALSNLLATRIMYFSEKTVDSIIALTIKLSMAFEKIDPEELLVAINRDREIAGLPEVRERARVEDSLKERRNYYRHVLHRFLDGLSDKEHVKAVTRIVELTTNKGERICPVLVADLVNNYEVSAKRYLEEEAEKILSKIEEINRAVDRQRGDSEVSGIIQDLIAAVKYWDFIAQPVQLSKKSQGLDHGDSTKIARAVRDLSIHLFNEHHKLDFAKLLTDMMLEVFAEVYSVSETLEEDAAILSRIENTGNTASRESPRPATTQQAGSGKSKSKILVPIVLLLVFLFYQAVSYEEPYKAPSKKPDPIPIKQKASTNTSSSNSVNPSNADTIDRHWETSFYLMKNNQQISAVQQLLKNRGYDVGVVDGKMGPRTSTAIKKYQLDKGITPDGMVTANLYGYLMMETPNKTIEQPVGGGGNGFTIVKPPVGSNNTLSIPQICWCLRERIRIDTMRPFPSTNSEIDTFNKFVGDYNIRCGSYRYMQSDMDKAKQEIAKYREQIIKNAKTDAQKIFKTAPATATASKTNAEDKSQKEKQMARIKEIQQLLNKLGYNAGFADGIFGSRTQAAIISFQRNSGLTQDGKISDGLLKSLKEAPKKKTGPIQSTNTTATGSIRQRAEKGDMKAQYILGKQYLEGDGVPSNDYLAVLWFRKSAVQGYSDAQYSLGLMYDAGWGVPQDYKTAAQWYEKAAHQGHTKAQYNLGMLYWVGWGVEKSDIKAERWFRFAASNGHQESITRLRDMGK